MAPFYKKILLIGFLFCIHYANGQVKISASANPSVINRNEYVTISYKIENAVNIENIDLPSFKNFTLVSGPMQQTGVTVINGNSSGFISISLVFKPRTTGTVTIPPASIKINGKVYKSNAVRLQILKTRSANPSVYPPLVQSLFDNPKPANTFKDYILKDGENVAEKVGKNMHLRLEVNKTSCYVGEPVVATYKLYTRLKSESKLTQNPSFSGFSVVDLQPADITASDVEKLDGRSYNVYTIRKAQLYPLQDGQIGLESAEIENKVQFIRESFARQNDPGMPDIFDEFAGAIVPPEGIIEQTVTLKSKPVSITVKPLPEAGKPANFKGTVGDFQIEAGLEKDTFTTGRSGKLIVMVTGSGNLQLMTPPQVLWPEGIESFDAKTSDILSMTSVPVSGKKIFEYPFSVDEPGDYVLPGISLNYFDPEKEQYKIIKTKDLRFHVVKGSPDIPSSIAASPIVSDNTPYNKIFRDRKWLVFIISLLILSGLFVYLKKDKRRMKSQLTAIQSEKDASLNAFIEHSSINQQNPLAETEKCLYDVECARFYSLIMGEIKTFLSAKFNIPYEEVNKKSLAEKMDKKNISNDTVLSLQQLLQDIEWQLYTPFERNAKMEEIYGRAHGLLQLINTYDSRVL